MIKNTTVGGLILIASALAVNAATLTIKVSGVKAGKGDIRVGVFNSEDEFPNGTYFKGVAVPGTNETVTVEVPDLPAGSYSVSIYQDLNGNKKIDKNFVGMPKEPYGFSGDWKSGGAKFKEASIVVDAKGSEISIKMK